MRHGVERPNQFAGARVECSQISWRGFVFFARSRTQNQQVFEDTAGITRLNSAQRVGIAPQSIFDIHLAVVAERHHGIAGCRIQRLQLVSSRKKNAAIAAILVFPVRNAAVIHGLRIADAVLPNLGARGGVQCNNRVMRPDQIHHAVNHNWVRSEAEPVIACWEKPRSLQPRHIRFIDLRKCGILGRTESSQVYAPATWRGCPGRNCGYNERQKESLHSQVLLRLTQTLLR